ncbi:hypothetical protein TNCV_1929001 [Trichonephila clavipes]|nr:hypothetical protein TNCV_1929001 [Trichonephila clavipes]
MVTGSALTQNYSRSQRLFSYSTYEVDSLVIEKECVGLTLKHKYCLTEIPDLNLFDYGLAVKVGGEDLSETPFQFEQSYTIGRNSHEDYALFQ